MSISDWRPLDRNTLRASFTLATPSGMVIHDCTYHTKNDSRWIGLPARSYEKDGVRKWVPLVEFIDRVTANKFMAAVLTAIDEIEGAHR